MIEPRNKLMWSDVGTSLKEKLSTSAMNPAMDKRAERESKQQLPEDFSAKNFDFVRARTLSSQI
jgi:hypothetical protein